MNSYLGLVAQSGKYHTKNNRIMILCIAISVCLVTTVFGLADMGLRSERALQIKEQGNYHIILRNLNAEGAQAIGEREDVAVSGWSLAAPDSAQHGHTVRIIAADEDVATAMGATMKEGAYPQAADEVIVDSAFLERFGLSIGDRETITMWDGREIPVIITGVFGDFSVLMRKDEHGVFFSELGGWEHFGDGLYAEYIVQFAEGINIRAAIREIELEYQAKGVQISENTILLGLMGYGFGGGTSVMSQLYGVALVLFLLVLAAGTVMITASFNTNAAQRVRFFGLMRCLGATRSQIRRFVILEGLRLSLKGIPLGMLLGTVLTWIACGLLKYLNSNFFSEMPLWNLSWVGLIAGLVIGLVTVLLAALSPANKASKVSPITASSGNVDAAQYMAGKAAPLRSRIDIGMGVGHALAKKKNVVLMTCSFAISIVLFLGFQVFVTFTHQSMPPLRPGAPDLSITQEDSGIPPSLLSELESVAGVKAVYGRMFYYDVPVSSEGGEHRITLVSYDIQQFRMAESELVAGGLADVLDGGAVLSVHRNAVNWDIGSAVRLQLPGGEQEVAVVGVLSTIPFDRTQGSSGYLVCSEETFCTLTGQDSYTVIDLQLEDTSNNAPVSSVRSLLSPSMTLSDRRLSNSEATANFYTAAVFVYGFLGIIALITVFHIVNSMNASISSRFRQCGIMRALGMSVGQLCRMVLSEVFTYTILGVLTGCLIGIPVHRMLYRMLVTYQFGMQWEFPGGSVFIIIAMCCLAASVAVVKPIRTIRGISPVELLYR